MLSGAKVMDQKFVNGKSIVLLFGVLNVHTLNNCSDSKKWRTEAENNVGMISILTIVRARCEIY